MWPEWACAFGPLNGHLDHSEGPACPSSQNRAGEHGWEDSPVTVASPRHSSSSCSGREIAWESKNRGQELSTTVQVQTQARGGISSERLLCFAQAQSKVAGEEDASSKSTFPYKVLLQWQVILAISIKHLLYFQGIHFPKSSKNKPKKKKKNKKKQKKTL